MIFMNAFNLHWLVYYFLRISELKKFEQAMKREVFTIQG